MRIIACVILALSFAAGTVYVVTPNDTIARSCVETNTCP